MRSQLSRVRNVEGTTRAEPAFSARSDRRALPRSDVLGERFADECFSRKGLAARLRQAPGRYLRSTRVVAGEVTLPRVVQPGRDSRARSGACSAYESDSAGPLADRRESDDRQAPRGRTVRAGVVPAFMLKQNSALVGNSGRQPTTRCVLSLANLGSARADPVPPCFGDSAGIAAVDLRALRGEPNVAGHSLGAGRSGRARCRDAVA